MKTPTIAPETEPLQQLFNRAGLHHRVTVSDRLRAAYQMSDDFSQPEWVELAWIVNLVLNQCVPSVELATPRGRVHIAEFSSVPIGQGDTGERQIGVLQEDSATLHVALPEEICPSDKRILMVEDDAHLREVISQFLVAAKIPHEWAVSGEEALEKLRTHLPVAVVSDIEMPGINGLELCRRIKADVQTRYIPVLLMSGNPDYEHRAQPAGAAGFFAKPLDLLKFVARLKKLIA